MNMPARELRCAAGGFLVGFLVCYLLIGAFQSHQPASPPIAKVTPATASPPVPPFPLVQVTNVAPPRLRIQSPPRGPAPGLLPGRPHPGYSLDLIDTHAEPPKLRQDP